MDFFFKGRYEAIGAITWESISGKEFNREKIKADKWKRNQLLDVSASPWSLNSFIPGVS